MLELKIIHDKNEVLKYLKTKEYENFMYHCAHLEEGLWEYSQFYGLYDEHQLLAMAVVSVKHSKPLLIASSYCEEDIYQSILLQRLQPILPQYLNCHINPQSQQYLSLGEADIEKVPFYNMQYKGSYHAISIEAKYRVMPVTTEHKLDLIALLELCHDEYILEESYLEQGYYYGVWEGQKLVSVAGVFQKSDTLGVVHIKNMSTHPDYRGQKLVHSAMSALMGDERVAGKHIVLTVRQDNESAIHTYQALGFEVIGVFDQLREKNAK
ncbi:MAG: GNAT family N-acetyltransferase [Cellulosilyticaceae bacterium]